MITLTLFKKVLAIETRLRKRKRYAASLTLARVRVEEKGSFKKFCDVSENDQLN